jgi:hypothetical protein
LCTFEVLCILLMHQRSAFHRPLPPYSNVPQNLQQEVGSNPYPISLCFPISPLHYV